MAVFGKRLQKARKMQELLKKEKYSESEGINTHKVRQMIALEQDDIDISDKEVKDYLRKSIKKTIMKERDYYYMFMSKDTRHFTIFRRVNNTPINTFVDNIVDFLIYQVDYFEGPVKSFQVREDGNFEIWYGGTMYLLFPYGFAVEEVYP